MKKLLCSTLLMTALFVSADTDALTLDFESNPVDAGFAYSGLIYDSTYAAEAIAPDPASFAWNSTNGTLDCTWDSNKNNSVFAKTLPFSITDTSDFSCTFELELDSISAEDYFQIAVGFRDMNVHNFNRGGKSFSDQTDTHICKNIAEWCYTAANPYGAGPFMMPTLCSADGDDFMNNWGPATTSTLQVNTLYRITQSYDATTRAFSCYMWQYDSGSSSWVEISTDDVTTSIIVAADKHFSLNAFSINQYYDSYNSNATGNTLVGAIDNVSYYVDTNTSPVEDWELFVQ